MGISSRVLPIFGLALAISAAPVAAQNTVGAKLSALLTVQSPPPPGFERDVAAAEATRDTVAGLFLVELANQPLVASAGGFVYRLNPALGTVERASDAFGPFFTERAVRVGRRQGSFGFAYQRSHFSTLQGASLSAGSFPTNASRATGSTVPFSVDTLSLEIDSQAITAFGNYGISDRLDVGFSVPIVRLSFNGRRTNTLNGFSTLQSAQSGSATGLGDIAVNARYSLLDRRVAGLAVGGDLYLPTGSSDNLLGAGEASAQVVAIASTEHRRVGLHGNVGYGFGGVSDEIAWSGAVTVAATPKLTCVGELIGRRLNELRRVRDVYLPHSSLANVETMRWLPVGDGVHTALVNTGVKWNVAESWLLNANLLIRLTDTGLSSRITPSLSFDYVFGR